MESFVKRRVRVKAFEQDTIIGLGLAINAWLDGPHEKESSDRSSLILDITYTVITSASDEVSYSALITYTI